MIPFIFHVERDGEVILSNLPNDLIDEMNQCSAVTQAILCPQRGILKRQKKLLLQNGFVYLCSYDSQLTKKTFNLCFEVFSSLVSSFDDSVKRKAMKSYEIVKALRHNVYGQLSHIQDEMKSLISFEDIPSKEWGDLVSYSSNKIISNSEDTAKSIYRTIKRTAIALSEFDAYELIHSSSIPDLYPHSIHKVIKLSLQPYLFDFWDNRIKVSLGESYYKTLIDYELVNLAFGHFWNNAIKYAKPDSEIRVSFSDYYTNIVISISMYSLAIAEGEIDLLTQKGFSGEYARGAKLNGHGLGMYYINECVQKCNGTLSILRGTNITHSNNKPFAMNTFKFSFPKAE